MHETHPFIDLTNITLPFTHQELFDDLDYDIVHGKSQLSVTTRTTNFEWHANPSKDAPPSILGLLTNKKIARVFLDFINDTFVHPDIIAPVKSGFGRKYLPFTLLKFHGNSYWHREGIPYWASEQEKQMMISRNNFAVNFPFYGETEKTSVEFGKGTPEFENMFANLTKRHLRNFTMMKSGILSENIIDDMSNATISNGCHTGMSMDHIVTADQEKHIETIGVKDRYDCPYIIPLSSWHKVTTSGDNRLSFRLMGNNKYTFSDICKLFDNSDLIKD
jgi:hypothetical protein